MTLDYLTVAEAARRLEVSVRTVHRYIRRGDLQATKIGPGTAAYLIAPASLEALEGNTTHKEIRP